MSSGTTRRLPEIGPGHANDVGAVEHGPVWAAQLFLASLLVPYTVSIGSILLMPHRLVLLLLFIPFFLRLFVLRRAGPVLVADWLLFGSALWAGAALAANHPIGTAIEPFGIHMIEFFGAYLLARVAIRSVSDFRRMVKTFFWMVSILMLFAAAESFTHRPVMLDLLPGPHVGAVDAGARFGMRRAQTVFAHPILFGVFVSTGLGLFWYALRPRWLRFPAIVVTGLATIFSLSTGALISFVMQSVFIGWEMVLRVLKWRWTLFAILAVLGYVVVDLISNRTPFHVLVTYGSFNTGSAYNRILIWQYGTENVWANPIFGLGLNDWGRPSWMSSSVDNYWLLVAMQFGLPAIFMLLAALALILRAVARADLLEVDDKLCRAAYLVAFGGLFIAGGTVHYWHAMMAFVMFIYGSGIWAATGGATIPARQTTPNVAPRLSRYTRQPAFGSPIGTGPRVASRAAGSAASRGRRDPTTTSR